MKLFVSTNKDQRLNKTYKLFIFHANIPQYLREMWQLWQCHVTWCHVSIKNYTSDSYTPSQQKGFLRHGWYHHVLHHCPQPQPSYNTAGHGKSWIVQNIIFCHIAQMFSHAGLCQPRWKCIRFWILFHTVSCFPCFHVWQKIMEQTKYV